MRDEQASTAHVIAVRALKIEARLTRNGVRVVDHHVGWTCGDYAVSAAA